MIRCKPWNGKALAGQWWVTRKVDGVRALRRMKQDHPLSRRGKKLYNISHLQFYDAEIYLGGFKRTIQAVRTQHEVERVKQEHVFHLEPCDKRLLAGRIYDPTPDDIRRLLAQEVKRGFEGIVLRQDDCWIKVVPRPTHDVRITGTFEGEGKFKGMLGGFITAKGKVGTGKGLTTKMRQDLWRIRKKLPGRIIEVTVKRWSDDGMMIQASFTRLREDK